jgi:hypothetical protein
MKCDVKTGKMDKRGGGGRFDLLISNFAATRSPDAIVDELEKLAGRGSLGNKQYERCFDGIRIHPANLQVANALLERNGLLIFNWPLWIIRVPWGLFAQQGPYEVLRQIFLQNCCNGKMDLGNLQTKIGRMGVQTKWIDFGNRDFVEFLLYRLGSESRDQKFIVRDLILTGNGIQQVDAWSSFLRFLPDLRTIVLHDNHISRPPNLGEWNRPLLVVEWNPARQTGPGRS